MGIRVGKRAERLNSKKNYRVLNVGDSFVQSEQIPFEQTFGELLNHHFGYDIEFVSHGIRRWAPTVEFAWVYHVGVHLDPDEVNLFLCINDFPRKRHYHFTDQTYRETAIYNGSVPVGFEMQEGVEVNDRDRTFKSKIINNIRIVSLLYHGTYQPLKKWLGKKLRKDENSDLSGFGNEAILLSQPVTQWPKDLKENVDETMEVVKNLHAFLVKRGIRLNVLMVAVGFGWKDEAGPGKEAYGWNKDATLSQEGIEKYLQEFLKQANIPFIDIRSAFEKYKRLNPHKALFFPLDGHWNEEGHSVVFDVLRKHYEQERK